MHADSDRGLGKSQVLPRTYGAVARGHIYCVTTKFVALSAVPPGVVIPIFPVFAPTGTVAVTCVSELTVKAVAFTPPNVT